MAQNPTRLRLLDILKENDISIYALQKATEQTGQRLSYQSLHALANGSDVGGTKLKTLDAIVSALEKITAKRFEIADLLRTQREADSRTDASEQKSISTVLDIKKLLETDRRQQLIEVGSEALLSHPVYEQLEIGLTGIDWPRFVASIKEKGVLLPPVVSIRTQRCVIVDGHLRVRAARELGIKTLTVRVENFEDEEAEVNHMRSSMMLRTHTP